MFLSFVLENPLSSVSGENLLSFRCFPQRRGVTSSADFLIPLCLSLQRLNVRCWCRCLCSSRLGFSRLPESVGLCLATFGEFSAIASLRAFSVPPYFSKPGTHLQPSVPEALFSSFVCLFACLSLSCLGCLILLSAFQFSGSFH